MNNDQPTHTQVNVSIHGEKPPYRVILSPPGPYRITAAGSTVTMTLDPASVQAGFRLYGIGFRDPSADSQLSAEVSTTASHDDTSDRHRCLHPPGPFRVRDALPGRARWFHGLRPRPGNRQRRALKPNRGDSRSNRAMIRT